MQMATLTYEAYRKLFGGPIGDPFDFPEFEGMKIVCDPTRSKFVCVVPAPRFCALYCGHQFPAAI